MSQHIYTMHLTYDKSYLKTHDSISLDVMINLMLDGIPYLMCTCNFTICLSLFHVLWAVGLNHNKPFVPEVECMVKCLEAWFYVCPLQGRKTYEPQHDTTNKMICAPCEDSNQPGWASIFQTH